MAKLEHARYTGEAEEWNRAQGFDRINMGNSPDYAGHSLMSHLFASPLVKRHNAASVSMCSAFAVLCSAPQYGCLRTALPTKADVKMALGVEHQGYLLKGLSTIALGRRSGMAWYNSWSTMMDTHRQHRQRLSPNALCTWLYGLFLRIALPSDARSESQIPGGPPPLIHSAMNVSVFFRLLSHLAEIGYPGHILSQILLNILNGSVITSARPVISQVLTIEEVTTWQSHSKQSSSTAPFIPEMSTQASIFTEVLPFAIIASHGVVPPLHKIRKCTVRFPHLPYEENMHYLALVFISFDWKMPAGGWGTDTIRGLMLNQDYITKHSYAIVVITAWKYSALTKTGTFWLREDIARKMEPDH